MNYAPSTSAIPGQARTTTLGSFNGENVNGEWQIRVTDNATGDVGSFLGFVLNISGAAVPEPGALTLVALGGLILLPLRRKQNRD